MTNNPPVDVLTPRGLDTPAITTPAPEPANSAPAATVDVAKDQAASVGQSASDAGQHVAAVAQDQAKNVVAEAGSQAKDLLAQTRTELGEQAAAQQQRLASGLHALGDELHSMTQHSEQAGVATDLARQGATRSHDIATWLEDREPGNLVTELQSFARQRPGTFLLAAAGAGLLVGRLTRGVKDASSDDTEASTSDARSQPAHAAAPMMAPPEQFDALPGSDPLGAVGSSSGPGL